MKKFLFVILVLVLLLTCAVSLAEAVDAVPPLFDWSQIMTDIVRWLVGILTSALLALASYYGNKYVAPWLKENRLTALAQELVRAAEARFGRQQGEKKLQQVFAWLRDRGVDIKDEQVIQAVMAAWQDLDLEMIAIGVKEPPDEVPAQ